MSPDVQALLSATLLTTGVEAYVWDIAANTLHRMRAGCVAETLTNAREHMLSEVDRDYRASVESALQARAPFEVEYTSRGRWVRNKGSFDGNRLIGTITDISDEKKNLSSFKKLVDNIPDFIARVDLDGRFIYLNRASESNAFGRPRHELIGKTPAELGFNDDTAAILRNAELRVINSGEPQRIELELEGDLRDRRLDVLLMPERDHAGRVVSILRVTRDITPLKEAENALRESEERLRLATRASLAMIYDWNMVTNETYRSDAVRELTGYGPEETERSEWWISDIHPDDRIRAQARVDAAVANGEDRYENEYRVRHRDGTWRYVWDRGFIVRDTSGRAVRAVGSTVDVTARRLAEEELKAAHRREQEARAEAERANRAKDDFLATLSHELRTPMTSILGWTSMLSHGLVEPASMPLAIRSIHDSAHAQAQLIEDLLDVSRVATGKLHMDMRPIDLVSIIASSVESFRIAAAERSVDLRVAINSAGMLILGDEKRVRQIVTNLLANALKFTPSGGRIEVVLAEEDSAARVIVRDSGRGITPEFLPHVFDRFSQQDSTESRAHGGLGIGLAIVRQLVELHGGLVRAESAGTDRGSTFTVTFPRLGSVMRGKSEAGPGARRVPRLDGVRVLLVEDEPNSRNYMESLLASCGAEVRCASSVAEALKLDEDQTIVVSDIAMPGEDGLSLIAKLRLRDARAGRRTPALAVTALGFGDDRRRILSAGFDEYLAKPVEPMVLLETVAALLNR